MTEPKMTKTNMTITTDLLHELDHAAEDRGIGRNKLIDMLLTQGLATLKPVESLFEEKDQDRITDLVLQRAAEEGL